MTEGRFDESLFYSRGEPLDHDPSLDTGAPTGHNHCITGNIPQYLSAVDNDCYGRVSVNFYVLKSTFKLAQLIPCSL